MKKVSKKLLMGLEDAERVVDRCCVVEEVGRRKGVFYRPLRVSFTSLNMRYSLTGRAVASDRRMN
jgi:hypothetical protein